MKSLRSPIILTGAVATSGLVVSLSAAGPFYGDPPDETHPWAVHDMHRPQPPVVEPGTPSTKDAPGKPPSDAIVLFDGTEATLSNWVSDKNPGQRTDWVVKDGALQCVPGSGYIRTKEEFGDCQLHVEWAAPSDVQGSSQGRGNSGVFLMGMAEIQVLDTYDNPTYADGAAASLYGIHPPLANPLRPPGQYQVYDIIFRRPLFKDGKEIDPGRVTVFCNGVVVQDAAPLEGPGGHRGRSHPREFPEAGPLKLQDHGNPVRFRNIWYRPLPPRPAQGGTDGGRLSPEATLAKRAETAAALRDEAAGLDGNAKMYKLLESLTYADDPNARKTAETMAAELADQLADASPQELEPKKNDVLHFKNTLGYLAKFDILEDDFAAIPTVQKVVSEQGWDER